MCNLLHDPIKKTPPVSPPEGRAGGVAPLFRPQITSALSPTPMPSLLSGSGTWQSQHHLDLFSVYMIPLSRSCHLMTTKPTSGCRKCQQAENRDFPGVDRAFTSVGQRRQTADSKSVCRALTPTFCSSPPLETTCSAVNKMKRTR